MISKKELLEVTGISYGQLYRWKREGLIPEEWFVKQASFTGQETFFPRKKILERVAMILEMKDKYQLDELAKILSPEISDRRFTKSDLALVEEVGASAAEMFCSAFDKESFTYGQLLVLICITDCMGKIPLSRRQGEELCAGLSRIMEEDIKSTSLIFNVLRYKQEHLCVVFTENTQFFPDSRMETVYSRLLEDVSSGIKLKYRSTFKNVMNGGNEKCEETSLQRATAPVPATTEG